MNPQECCDELASHYHLMFENWEDATEHQATVLGAILELEGGLTNASRILDCACGIGTKPSV